MINRQSHAFECNFGIIALANRPNCTRYASALPSLFAHAIILKLHSKACDYYTNKAPGHQISIGRVGSL